MPVSTQQPSVKNGAGCLYYVMFFAPGAEAFSGDSALLRDEKMDAPALLKILCLFSGIVVLYRLKLPLWAALLAMTAAAGLWFGAGPAHTAQLMARSAYAAETLFLCAVVVLILGFSNLLDKTGALEGIVAAFRTLLGRSMYSGAALPALIGVLPMPGGAIFSAPMVDTACGPDGEQSPEQKAAINYWFRHVWEYWWPLYPGVILATHLFGVSMWQIVALHLPLSVAAVAGGYFFILRPAFAAERKAPPPDNGNRGHNLSVALKQSAPLIVVVATIFIAGPLLGAAGVSGLAAKYWPVIAGTVLGMTWTMAAHKTGFVQAMRHMLTRSQATMLMLAVGVMEFRDMLISVDAFAAARADLAAYHVPTLVVIAALPFISGFVMGLAVGFVGASFPLVISLLPAAVMGSNLRFAYLALAYCAGYMGMMLSPVHLCLLLTKDFFKADFGGIYRWILPASGVVLVAGAALFALYHTVFG